MSAPALALADVAARWPKPAFDLAALQRYDPPLSTGTAAAAGSLFLAALGGTSAFLWHAHLLAPLEQFAAAAALVAALWLVGVITQPAAAGDGKRLAAQR